MFTHSDNCKLQIIVKFIVSIKQQNRIIYRENSCLQLTDGLNQFSEDIRQTGANVSFPTYPKGQTKLGVTVLSLICVTGEWWWAAARVRSWAMWPPLGKLELTTIKQKTLSAFQNEHIRDHCFFLGRKYT